MGPQRNQESMAAEDYREQAGGCSRRDRDEQGRGGMEDIEHNALHPCCSCLLFLSHRLHLYVLPLKVEYPKNGSRHLELYFLVNTLFDCSLL